MAKKLKDSEIDELLKSDRPDKLVVLTAEDAEAVKATIKSLRPEKAAPKKSKK